MDPEKVDLIESVINTGGFFATLTLAVFFVARYQYRVKRMIVEQGGDPYASRSRTRYLEYAAIVAGVALGIVVAALVSESGLAQSLREYLGFGAVLLGAAAGLVGAHYIKGRLGES